MHDSYALRLLLGCVRLKSEKLESLVYKEEYHKGYKSVECYDYYTADDRVHSCKCAERGVDSQHEYGEDDVDTRGYLLKSGQPVEFFVLHSLKVRPFRSCPRCRGVYLLKIDIHNYPIIILYHIKAVL